jgi:hypothetical protein
MPEGIPYASTNVVAGAGLELNYVGNHVFAFSGGIITLAGNADATMLDMVTGSEYIVGDFVFFAAVDPNLTGGVKTKFKLTLNGVKVALSHQIDSIVLLLTYHSIIAVVLKVMLCPGLFKETKRHYMSASS